MRTIAISGCILLALITGCADKSEMASPSSYVAAPEIQPYAPEPTPSVEPETYAESAEGDEVNASSEWDDEHHDDEAHQEWEDRGYPCTHDCSGHEAGREWAERRGIDDPDDCGGNSQSFIEGCQAYAEEQGAPSGPG